MTISEPLSLYVWVWLPGATEPIVAGQVVQDEDTGIIRFGYGRSFRQRPGAVPIFLPDLPLRQGLIDPPAGHELAPSLRDALPDRWGRRVIVNDVLGWRRDEINEDALGEMSFMIRSGSDRIGALDFQHSATTYVPREAADATLEELQRFADLVEAGDDVPPALDRVILHGSSIGGARPKALITDTQGPRPRKLIAKFSASNDVFAMVKAEFVAMYLARRAGLDVAQVEISKVLGRDVLLVERFDRAPADGGGWTRRALVSALTWTQEHEMAARHIDYTELADLIRARFRTPKRDLRELFARMCFNILVGNTDDHARNHAAFWDGDMLELTPAYDIAPQPRGGSHANQAMNILPGKRAARLTHALEAAGHFQMTTDEARAVIDALTGAIVSNWVDACNAAGMSGTDRAFFAGRQFMNPYAFEGFGAAPNLP